MIKIIWRNEKRKVKDLKFFKGNPRTATEKQEKDLGTSLERFNLADPLVINTDNTVIGGNFRLRLLRKKDIEEIDVRVPSRPLNKKESDELNLRLNKNQGEWDWDLLENFGEDLLKDVGFENDELDRVFGMEIREEFDIEKELNKVLGDERRRVSEGDLWQLGEHRLVVGDCTKKENWEKLLGGERFDFMFTDPPYKLSYTKRTSRKLSTKTKDGFGYKKDRVYLGVEKRGGVPEFDQWLSIANEFQNLKGANIMVFENWKNVVELWQAIEKYWKIRNMVIWWLPNRSQGYSKTHYFFNKYDIAPLAGDGKLNGDYEEELELYLQENGQKLLDTYEVILYGQKNKSSWDRKRKTPWAKVSDHISWIAETGKSSGQSLIFGTKPVQILAPYIKILSPREGIVMEPFGGSGSTLIASEIMKRKCRVIELSEIYAEVIIKRWEKFTNRKAQKI